MLGSRHPGPRLSKLQCGEGGRGKERGREETLKKEKRQTLKPGKKEREGDIKKERKRGREVKEGRERERGIKEGKGGERERNMINQPQ